MKTNLQKNTGRSAFTLIELLVIIAIVGILASLLLPLIAKGGKWGFRKSDGFRMGKLVKLSEVHQGTHRFEAQLATTDNLSWAFTVEAENTQVLEQLKSAGTRTIRVTYTDRVRQGWSGDTTYRATAVEYLDSGTPAVSGASSGPSVIERGGHKYTWGGDAKGWLIWSGNEWKPSSPPPPE